MSQLPTPANVLHFGTVSSTMDVLRDLLTQNPALASYTTVTARHQEAGRGRQGRQWVDDGSALLMTTVVRVPDETLTWTSLVAGLCLAHALADEGVSARIKWPNDILVDGRKVAGILCEHVGTSPATRPDGQWQPETTRQDGDRSAPLHLVAVGVGVNLVSVPPSAGPLAGALASPDPSEQTSLSPLGSRILTSYLGYLRSFLDEGDATWWQRDCERLLLGIGQVTTLHHPDGSVRTITPIGIDIDGALLADEDGQRRRITVGDVDAPHPHSALTTGTSTSTLPQEGHTR